MSDQHRERRTTLADVAARAGVSRATASRALADDDRISPATQAVVRDAAAALEYVPNLAARSLRARHTRALGLLMSDMSDPVHGQVAAGFELVAAKAGYTVIIVAAQSDAATERRALRAFIERSTDGICLASTSIEPDEARDRIGGTPLVFIQPDIDMLITDPLNLVAGTIRADDAAGIEQAVQHLLASGYRDIAYLGSGDRATNRLRRFVAERTLRDAADQELRTFQVADDAWTTSIETAAIVASDLPEAVICYDDKTALALLDGLRTRGVDVPQDVAVVGFDGIPFAALSNPRLTTIETPASEMGRRGAETLLAAIENGELPPQQVLPVSLVVRESSVAREGNTAREARERRPQRDPLPAAVRGASR